MKNIFFIICLALLFSSCAKEPITNVQTVSTSSYIGEWHGPIDYNLNTDVIHRDNDYRQIEQINSEYLTAYWFFVPKMWTNMYFTNNTYSIRAVSTQDGFCNGKTNKWVFVFTGTGTLSNDTLVESGDVEDFYYEDSVLILHQTGKWKARMTKFISGRILIK